MSLFRRGPSVAVELQPASVRPSETLQVVVTLGAELTDVNSAKVELGYVNTFNYHWAGRRDAAMRHDDASLLTIGQVGTSHGSTRDAEEWVPCISEDLALMSGTLAAGQQRVAFRVPSWAPGSGRDLVDWAVRLVVERKGRDACAEAPLTVLVPAPAAAPAELRQERVTGDACDVDIRLDRPCWRAGETIRGTVTMTAHSEVPEVDVAVLLERERLSHPVGRTPSDGQYLDGGPRIQLDKHLVLTAGVPVVLPFEVPLPADSPPTAEAVHSSHVWHLQVRTMYKGFGGPSMDRVRREFVVYTALPTR